MNSLLIQTSEYIKQQSWHISILICTAMVLCWLLRHKSAHLRYMIWLIVLAKCLVPPVINITVALLPAETVTESVVSNTTEFTPAKPTVIPTEKPLVLPVKKSRLIQCCNILQYHWIITIWAGMAVLFYIISTVRMIRIQHYLRKYRTKACTSLQNDLSIVSQEYGLKKITRLMDMCTHK